MSVCKVCLEEEVFCACAPDAVPIPRSLAIDFENEHLSVSRLKLYEQCAHAFYLRYVNKGSTMPRGGAADFGVVLHATLEELYRWVVETEFSGVLPESKAIDCYRACWQASGLVGTALYQEGLAILRAYVREHARVDHLNILDIEREFNIDIDGFVMNGYIDRVDKLGDDHIAIIDYKSNRNLFTKDELESDLQMSIYGLAARELYPWAKRISFVFHMLRHDTHQGAERTAQQIDDARGYVVALGFRTEDPQNKFLPTLNENCSYCDHRHRCDEYARALAGKLEPTRVASDADMASIVGEREQLAKLAKAMYARKKELDELIRAKLGKEGEFTVAGYHYRFINQFDRSFPNVDAVLRAFHEAGVQLPVDEIIVVDKDLVEAARVNAIQVLDRQKAMLLNATLQAIQEKKPLTPRLDSHKVKTAKTAADVPGAATGDTPKRTRARKVQEGTT